MGISHITRAEFARLAIGGELDPHTQEHLSFCPSCRQQFESLQQGAKSGGEHLTDAEVAFFADREQDFVPEGPTESQGAVVDLREEHVLGCPQCLALVQGLRELLDGDLNEPVPLAVVKRAKGITRRHPATSLGRLLVRLFSGGVSFSFEPTLAIQYLRAIAGLRSAWRCRLGRVPARCGGPTNRRAGRLGGNRERTPSPRGTRP